MNDDERIIYRSLLAMVLQWRNFDGDGITDPLRQEIIKSLAFYKSASQPVIHADGEKPVGICPKCGMGTQGAYPVSLKDYRHNNG